MTLKYKIMQSPVGNLTIVADNDALVAILWDNEKPNRVKLSDMTLHHNDTLIRETEKQLTEYFEGKRKIFNLPLKPYGGTSFQKSVWERLKEIPYGSTLSYKNIAEQLNNPNAVRAVGSANGRNPISIIVPCHRVIGADGSLSGFAGGMDRKKILLDLEQKMCV